MQYAVIDIETTGGNAQKNAITEIAILIHDGKNITDTFHTLLNPEQFVPSFITNLTGITNEMVETAPTFSEVAEEMFSLLQNKIFVAHNAGFDYAFMKNKFEANGYAYQAKRLCTVRLSKKIFPGFQKYSLGKLSESLGIKIKDRHRALGDAIATAEIFSLLVKHDPGAVIETFLKRNSKEHYLPPQLDKKLLDQIPTQAGVYYFYDERGKILYIGKAKNLKSRILNHFTFADSDGKENALRNLVCDISYELTGNELIALLLESEEIKRKDPPYNFAQKGWRKNYCIFKYQDQQAYLRFAIEQYHRKKEVLRIFPNYLSAREYLKEKVDEFQLCPRLCNLQETKKECYHLQEKKCFGACVGSESVEAYNLRAEEAVKSFQEDFSTYLIKGKGRDENELSVIYVENGHYLGFGFLPNDLKHLDMDTIKEYLKWRPDTPDVQRILAYYLSKNPQQKIIPATPQSLSESP